MINVIVTGAAGRMGQRLISAVLNSPEMQLTGATEAAGQPSLGQDAGRVAGLGDIGVDIVENIKDVLPKADVMIDFTWPESSLAHLEAAAEYKKAAVVGTTGFTEDQISRIKVLTSSIPCVLAPNMSQGVNLMFELVRWAAGVLGEEYDLEVIEAHHRMKKDAPSGTAVKLGQVLAQVRGGTLEQMGRFHRQGMIGERSPQEIGMQTIRAGDIVGEHTVLMAGPGERLEITHRAHSRDTFTRGALRAVKWVVKQEPGLYSMLDVLGLRG